MRLAGVHPAFTFLCTWPEFAAAEAPEFGEAPAALVPPWEAEPAAPGEEGEEGQDEPLFVTVLSPRISADTDLFVQPA